MRDGGGKGRGGKGEAARGRSGGGGGGGAPQPLEIIQPPHTLPVPCPVRVPVSPLPRRLPLTARRSPVLPRRFPAVTWLLPPPPKGFGSRFTLTLAPPRGCRGWGDRSPPAARGSPPAPLLPPLQRGGERSPPIPLVRARSPLRPGGVRGRPWARCGDGSEGSARPARSAPLSPL